MVYKSESLLNDYIKYGTPSFIVVKEQLVRDYTLHDMPLARYRHNASILFENWKRLDRTLW